MRTTAIAAGGRPEESAKMVGRAGGMADSDVVNSVAGKGKRY
jgi:hypothetical protein